MDLVRRFWAGWRRVGRFVGDVIGRLFLTVFYFTIFVPFALLVRFSSDPLSIRTGNMQTYWIDRVQHNPDLRGASRQF